MIDRIEKKFLLKKSIINEFINFIEIKKKMKRHFINRKIHSIYLDNQNERNVIENLNGFAKRFKIRFRWYNQNQKKVFHEIKIKKGNKTEKIIKQINFQNNILDVLKKGNLDKYLGKEFTYQEKFFPVCLVAYQRAYYINNFCRLTIDNDIRYFNINNNKLNTNYIKEDFVIIELKFNEIAFDDFSDFNMNFGSLINVRMSKYMRARSYFLNFEYF